MLLHIILKEVNCDGKLIPELINHSTKMLVDAGVIHALKFNQGNMWMKAFYFGWLQWTSLEVRFEYL